MRVFWIASTFIERIVLLAIRDSTVQIFQSPRYFTWFNVEELNAVTPTFTLTIHSLTPGGGTTSVTVTLLRHCNLLSGQS
jgi:hypothetical protein